MKLGLPPCITSDTLHMVLHYSEELAPPLLERVRDMQESTMYQAVLSDGRTEGRITGAKELLVRQGTKSFGEPDTAILAAIEAIRAVGRLKELDKRLLDPEVWLEHLFDRAVTAREPRIAQNQVVSFRVQTLTRTS